MLCTLLTIDQFENTRSQEDLFFIYKYNSKSCPVSERTLNTLLELQHKKPKPIYFVDVIHTKELSAYIGQTLAVRHESPQIISIKKSRAYDMVSHMSITEEWIQTQYDQLSNNSGN